MRSEGRGWGLLLAVELSRLQPGAEAGGAARTVMLQANSSSVWRRMENSPEIPRLGLVWGMTHPWHSPPSTLPPSQQPVRAGDPAAMQTMALPSAWQELLAGLGNHWVKTPRGRSNPATQHVLHGLRTVHFSPFAFCPTWLQSKPWVRVHGRLG